MARVSIEIRSVADLAKWRALASWASSAPDVEARAAGAELGAMLAEVSLPAGVVRSALGSRPPRAATSKPSAHTVPVPSSPAEFARAVYQAADAARMDPGAWFGDERAFVVHVWRRFATVHTITLEEFKQRLLAANGHTLWLGRAELPHIMDPESLRLSRIEDRHVAYVFVKVRP